MAQFQEGIHEQRQRVLLRKETKKNVDRQSPQKVLR